MKTMKIIECPVKSFKIIMTDSAKRSAYKGDYANAGFFGTYHESGEAFTLPAAHLVCDYAAESKWTKKYCTERGTFAGDKFCFDSGNWTYQNRFYGKSVSTLVVKSGRADVVDLAHVAPDCDYAISGVPIMRGGEDVTFDIYVKGQGWDSSTLYATYHVFLGLKADRTKIYIIGMKTKTGNMITSAEAYKTFKPMGFEDVIKLAGGGSYIFTSDGETEATSENRRINTIITFRTEEESTERRENKNKKMLKVAIDAGHYLYTSGKRCLKSLDPNETREWVLNARVADKLRELLKYYDCEILRVDDTTGENYVSLDERTKASNKWNADVYLSIHHNAGAGGTTAGGTVVYWYSSNEKREGQAEALYKCVVNETKLKGNRADPVQYKGYDVLRNTNAPAFLLENGFMDSKSDTPIILTEEHANKTAKGIVNFLVSEFGIVQTQTVPLEETDTNVSTAPCKDRYNTIDEVPSWA